MTWLEDRMRNLESVVLKRSIPEQQLCAGDVGSIVHVYDRGQAFEVELVTADGKTRAVLTLERDSIRPIASTEILHVRDLHQNNAA